jgi:hypothetical protein
MARPPAVVDAAAEAGEVDVVALPPRATSSD